MGQHSLVLCALLLVAPVWGNLPSPVQPQQTQGPPPVTTPMPTTTAKVSNFQFDAFFDLFIKNYGKHALHDFQRELDARKQAEGIPVVYIPGDPIPCGATSVPSGAEITYDTKDPSAQQHEHGAMAQITCMTGYRGASSTIMCKSGVWTAPPTPVSCVMVTCDQMPSMPNAKVSVSSNQYGSQAVFTCNPGFQANHLSKPIVCQSDGTWSTPSFRCIHPTAFHQQPSQTNNGGAAGALGGMMAGFGGGAARPSLSPSLMNVAKQAMANAMAGAGGAGAAGANPMASVLGGMASMTGAAGAAGGGPGALMSMIPGMAGMASMFGNMGGAAAGANPMALLPPHLKSMAQALPMLAGGMGAGPMGVPGMPGMGGPGAGASQMEPEERMMMAMVMSQMQQQQMMRAKRQRELQQQQQEKNAEQKQGSSGNMGINISDLLAKGAMGGSGGNTPQNQMMSALSAMAKLMGQQMGGSSSSTEPGETGSNPQSVFGSTSGPSPATSSSGSSSSTSNADAAAQAMRAAIMKAAMGNMG